MGRSLMADAFAHHVWASVRLIDACLELSPEQLGTAVPGTYGSILQTHRHLAGSDAWELFVATGDRGALFKPDEMSLLELRAAMEGHGTAWSRIVAEAPDPDTLVEEVDDEDGYKRRSPIGVLLAGVLQHGTEHRSQICTALTAFSIIPPHISVVDYGLESGRVAELYPGADETATQKYERFNLPDEGVGARILHSVR